MEQSVGADPLEHDVIEVEPVELSLAGGAVDVGDLLGIEPSDPQLEFAQPELPQVAISRRVNDLSQDPTFGPFFLTAVPSVAISQPDTALLLAAGGLVLAAASLEATPRLRSQCPIGGSRAGAKRISVVGRDH